MRSKNKQLMDDIKAYIDEYAIDHAGATPSTRELGAQFGVSHVSIFRYLRAMDELGMLKYENGEIRTDLIDKIEPAGELSPAYYDAISAGTPDEVEGEVDEYVSIPAVFTDGIRGSYFILRVNGESMVDAGIDDGDIVILRKQHTARVGDIVAALVDGAGSTLKRILSDDEGLYLWAENESWEDEERLIGRNFSVQGKAVKVVKDIK